MKHIIRYILLSIIMTIGFGCFTVTAATAPVTPDKPETDVEPVIPPVTDEPITSDLTLLQAETVLDSMRWIQSFAKDNTYYYFVQMTNPDKGHLRITRVCYTGPGIYSKDHMDLRGFGHGTNLDCSVYKGKTYLWIGSMMNKDKKTTAISCFPYKANAIYTKKAGKTYKIRKKDSIFNAKNVFPAVSSSGKYLYVRYTSNNKQYFQKYRIYNGNKIKTYKILGCLKIPATPGDFQGFDATDNYIYTIEGSPTAEFLASYDTSRVFQPTIVRRIHFRTKSRKVKVISGASTMAFREPEGIKILKNGKMEMLFVSNTLTFQKCNLYRIK